VENHKSMHGGRNRSAPNKSTCKSSDSVRHRHSGPYRRRCPEQVADVEGLRRRRQQEEKQQRTPGEGENGCHPLVFVCASRRVWCAGKKWIGRLAEREIFGLFPVAGGRRPAGLFIQAWSGWTCVCVRKQSMCLVRIWIRGAAYLGRGSFGRASYWDRITRTLWSLGQLLKQSYTATAPAYI